jgi:hypothetical protein
MNEPLLDYSQLSVVTNRPVRTLRTLKQSGKIPFYALGHKLVLFQASKVFDTLEKYEVKAATRSRRPSKQATTSKRSLANGKPPSLREDDPF